MDMRQRWIDFWAERMELDRKYAIVSGQYSQSGRPYHNFFHIELCLERFDEVRFLAERASEVEAAIWFHDVIYDPKDRDNEAASMGFARGMMSTMGFAQEFKGRVGALIEATKHDRALRDNDQQLIADIDLSVAFGVDWEAFQKSTADVREEYKHVSPEDWQKGRRRVLKMFLDREHIFYLRWFRNRFEKMARANLKRGIRALA